MGSMSFNLEWYLALFLTKKKRTQISWESGRIRGEGFDGEKNSVSYQGTALLFLTI